MWVEAIHFTQYLVQCLLAFIMSTTETGAAGPAHRVDFIDKDDGWCFLAGTGKHVAHPRCTNTDKHFDKFRAADTEKRYIGFTGHCFGQQGFAGTRRSHQQNSPGDFRTQFTIVLGIFEITHNFIKVALGIFQSGDIIETQILVLLAKTLGPGFTKIEEPCAAEPAQVFLHPAGTVPEQADDQDPGYDPDQCLGQPVSVA